MIRYEIKNFEKIFLSSECKKLTGDPWWFRMPNKHDSLGYRTVAAHAKRHELYSGWILILQVASKMPTRGLLHNGDRPLTAKDLSLMTGFPAATFEMCLEVLSDPEIGWLIADQAGEAACCDVETSEPAGHPAEPAGHPAEPAGQPCLEKRREEKRRIEKNRSTPQPPSGGKRSQAPPGEDQDSSRSQSTRKRVDRETVKEEVLYPEALRSDRFKAEFEAWIEHRMGLKKPGVSWVSFFQRQLDRECEPIGEERAFAMVAKSTSSGHQGLYEPTGGGSRRNGAPTESEVNQEVF